MNARIFRPSMLTFAFLIVFCGIGSFSCQKNTKEPKADSAVFDSDAVKEWYYGVFKKSAEFKLSKESGKKLPDWKHGVYRKVGNMEIVEFPLNRNNYTFPLNRSGNFKESELMQIASGSLSRISFIRKGTGEIFIREVNYIPTLSFLQSHNYDISGVHLGINHSGDFTGRVQIKKWDGSMVTIQELEKGTVIRVGKKKNIPNASSVDATTTNNDCSIYEICEYERQCTDYYVGDEWVKEECTPWTATGFCWYEEYCPPQLCDYGSSESCECQLFGTGCGVGNGDGDGLDCTNAEAEAYEQVQNIWDSYITKDGITPESFDAVNTSFQPDIFVDEIREWTIGTGGFGTWAIRAKTKIMAMHDNVSMNDNATLTLQHLGSYYSGSHILVHTTWKEDPISPPVITGNHTPTPRGYYAVTGVITHRMMGEVETSIGPCKIKIKPIKEISYSAGNTFSYRISY